MKKGSDDSWYEDTSIQKDYSKWKGGRKMRKKSWKQRIVFFFLTLVMLLTSLLTGKGVIVEAAPLRLNEVTRGTDITSLPGSSFDPATDQLITFKYNRSAGFRINHPAYKNYKKLKGGHEETVKSIILMVNAKLRLIEVPEIARIFEENELDIDSLGTGKNWDEETKTAIFLVFPEQDKSFDFVLGMVYTQIFNRLIELADTYFRGPLPIPVEFLMDEFANGVRPVGFDKYITTVRSRNMSAVMAVQSVDQIKTIYKGDT